MGKTLIHMFLKSVKLILFFLVLFALIMGVMVGFMYLQSKLINPKDYIIHISSQQNFKILNAIFIIFIFFMIFVYNFRKEAISFLNSKRKVLYAIGVLLICIIFYTLFNFSAVYKNSIKRYSIFYPKGKTYTYNDIKDVKVYIKSSKFKLKKNYDFCYVIDLKDNSSIDLNPAASNSEKEFHDALLDIDKQIKKNKIKKIANKTYLNKYGKNLDKLYVNKVKRLFE